MEARGRWLLYTGRADRKARRGEKSRNSLYNRYCSIRLTGALRSR